MKKILLTPLFYVALLAITRAASPAPEAFVQAVAGQGTLLEHDTTRVPDSVGALSLEPLRFQSAVENSVPRLAANPVYFGAGPVTTSGEPLVPVDTATSGEPLVPVDTAGTTARPEFGSSVSNLGTTWNPANSSENIGNNQLPSALATLKWFAALLLVILILWHLRKRALSSLH
jgi:hypothetical protein